MRAKNGKRVKRTKRSARITILTEPIIRSIIEEVKAGSAVEDAVGRHHVTAAAYYLALQRTGMAREHTAARQAGIAAIDAEYIEKSLKVVRNAIDGGSERWAAWWLEKRMPSVFGKTVVKVETDPAPAAGDFGEGGLDLSASRFTPVRHAAE